MALPESCGVNRVRQEENNKNVQSFQKKKKKKEVICKNLEEIEIFSFRREWMQDHDKSWKVLNTPSKQK